MELTSGKEIEPLLRETIAAQIGQKKLDRWFPSSIRFDFRGERLAVLAPQENICGFLRSYRSEPLASACRQLFGREVPLDFLVWLFCYKIKSPIPNKPIKLYKSSIFISFKSSIVAVRLTPSSVIS